MSKTEPLIQRLEIVVEYASLLNRVYQALPAPVRFACWSVALAIPTNLTGIDATLLRLVT